MLPSYALINKPRINKRKKKITFFVCVCAYWCFYFRSNPFGVWISRTRRKLLSAEQALSVNRSLNTNDQFTIVLWTFFKSDSFAFDGNFLFKIDRNELIAKSLMLVMLHFLLCKSHRNKQKKHLVFFIPHCQQAHGWATMEI